MPGVGIGKVMVLNRIVRVNLIEKGRFHQSLKGGG